MRPGLALALALALMAGPALASDEAPRLEGDYSLDCQAPGLQCWWSIQRDGVDAAGAPSYAVRFTAADAMDASRVRCTATGTAFPSAFPIGGGLAATVRIGGEPASINLRAYDDGTLFAFAPYALIPDCDGVSVEGDLSPIGD